MSKLAYVFITLVGAVPAGGTNYLIVKYFLDHGFSGAPIVVAVCGATWVATFLTALTPLMVLVWYKAPQTGTVNGGATTTAVADGAAAVSGKDAKAAKGKKNADDGFGDAIPENFDEDELAESEGDYDDDNFEADDEDFDYADDEFEEEEEEQPKKKKKK